MNEFNFSPPCSSNIRGAGLSEGRVSPGCSKSWKLAPLNEFTAKYMAANPGESLDRTIGKLIEVISDPVTNDNHQWISRLLGHFIRDVGNNGYRLEHLEAVVQILEFLGPRTKSFEEYKIYLGYMLDLSKLPPLLRKTSDYLRCTAILERYFSTLGHLATILTTDEEILRVLEAIDCLLVGFEPVPPEAVKLRHLHAAMTVSRLPAIATKMAETSSPKLYPRVLDLTLLLVSISDDCSHKMLRAGILNHLLTRIKDSNPSQLLHEFSPGDENAEFVKEKISLSTDIMWYIVQAILPPKSCPPFLQQFPGPSTNATRCLRNVFRYQVHHSQGSVEGRILRNDLASLILAGSVAFPSWDLVRSGLAEDLIVLSVSDETRMPGTWTENILLEASNEDFILKKILLTVLYHLSSRGAAIAIMAKRNVIRMILNTMNPGLSSETRWNQAQMWYLSRFAIRTLGRSAIKMPREFVDNQGSARLIGLVEWSLSVPFDVQIVMEYSRAICLMAASNCPEILVDFRKEEMSSALTKLVERISAFDPLTTQLQRILTLTMAAIEAIANEEDTFDPEWKHESLDTVIKLLHRCSNMSNNDFPLDQRLLVAVGSYIWKCLVGCSGRSEKFIQDGGIYTILDIIEKSSFPVRHLYLGILVDISTNHYGAPHLCTWRGTDKNKGLVSLLAECWREEEIRTGVKRTTDGCIEDVELPMMGIEQRMKTFRARATNDYSPALASIFVSIAPKIYSLRKIMMNEAAPYQMSREHYRILLHDLPVEDRITMYVADHFYRFIQGQLWSEVSRYLEQIGVNILGMDGEITLLMNQRYRDWGLYVRGLQEKLLRAEKLKEAQRERDEMTRIRDSRLGTALTALRDIDYIRRTTDHDYILAKKKSQSQRVNAALGFPALSDEEHCHRTYFDAWKVTTILEHDHTIPSNSSNPVDIANCLPVLPWLSSTSEKMQPPSIKSGDSSGRPSEKDGATSFVPKKILKPVNKQKIDPL